MKLIKSQIPYNKSLRTSAIEYIVIHDTGNPAKGANAKSHHNYFSDGNRGSGADFFVDDKEVWRINDYNKYCTWHCGDGKGKFGITNNNSVGIELCINADGDYTQAFNNAVELTKTLMTELNIPIEKVVRHYDASRKNCPKSMSRDDWTLWKKFKEKLQEELTMTQYEELKSTLDDVYKKLDKIADNVREIENPMIYNYVDANMPEWARGTIQKLADKGILNGTGDGLGLTDDMLRILVMLNRAKAFD